MQNLRKHRKGASFNHLGHSLFALPPPAGAAMSARIQASTHASRQARRQPRSAKVEKSKSSFSRRARRGRSTATQNTSPRLARAVVVAAGRQARLRLTALLALLALRVPRPRSRSRRDACRDQCRTSENNAGAHHLITSGIHFSRCLRQLGQQCAAALQNQTP